MSQFRHRDERAERRRDRDGSLNAMFLFGLFVGASVSWILAFAYLQ